MTKTSITGYVSAGENRGTGAIQLKQHELHKILGRDIIPGTFNPHETLQV